MTKPDPKEYAEYYSRYVALIADDDIITTLSIQLPQTEALLRSISADKSLYRYASDKWSIRELTGHINDTERVFAFRALWFARTFDSPLSSFDQDISVNAAHSDDVAWPDLIDEFGIIRRSTISLFKALPDSAWSRSGIASENKVTVNALAYIIAGHTLHHVNVLKERYL